MFDTDVEEIIGTYINEPTSAPLIEALKLIGQLDCFAVPTESFTACSLDELGDSIPLAKIHRVYVDNRLKTICKKALDEFYVLRSVRQMDK